MKYAAPVWLAGFLLSAVQWTVSDAFADAPSAAVPAAVPAPDTRRVISGPARAPGEAEIRRALEAAWSREAGVHDPARWVLSETGAQWTFRLPALRWPGWDAMGSGLYESPLGLYRNPLILRGVPEPALHLGIDPTSQEITLQWRLGF